MQPLLFVDQHDLLDHVGVAAALVRMVFLADGQQADEAVLVRRPYAADVQAAGCQGGAQLGVLTNGRDDGLAVGGIGGGLGGLGGGEGQAQASRGQSSGEWSVRALVEGHCDQSCVKRMRLCALGARAPLWFTDHQGVRLKLSLHVSHHGALTFEQVWAGMRAPGASKMGAKRAQNSTGGLAKCQSGHVSTSSHGQRSFLQTFPNLSWRVCITRQACSLPAI